MSMRVKISLISSSFLWFLCVLEEDGAEEEKAGILGLQLRPWWWDCWSHLL